MLGAISGDTIGSVYEFRNTKDYNFPLFSPKSNYTDDSILSIAVARWLLDDPTHGLKTLEESFLTLAGEYPCPMGGYGNGFVIWLNNPLRKPYMSWGNGAAMRVSPVGWFFDTLEETERVAEISASVTHNHPEGIKGARSTAAAIWMARSGKSKEEIREYIEKTYGYDLHKTWEYWHPIYKWEASCQGTVPQAIIAFLDSVDFEDAMRKAVSLGGDSDTLACITGGIAEAFYGGVPETISVKVQKKLPVLFLETLKEMREKTDYDFRPII